MSISQKGKEEECDCSVAGEVTLSSVSQTKILVTYNIDIIPKGSCSSYDNYTVSFDLNTGDSKDITLKNNTTSNSGNFNMTIPSGQYSNVVLSVSSNCGGDNTVNVTKM